MKASVILKLLLLFCLAFGNAYAQKGSEVKLNEGTRISLQLNDYLSTKFTNEGDTFTANVTAPIYQAERVVIPKGSVIMGSVSRVVRPGRFRGKAVMNVLFHSIRISGKTLLPLAASLVSVGSEGNSKSEGTVEEKGSKSSDTARVLKPGLLGTGIGALVAGGKGAAIGGTVGAAVGVATIFATRGKELELPSGSSMEIVLDQPLVVPIELARN